MHDDLPRELEDLQRQREPLLAEVAELESRKRALAWETQNLEETRNLLAAAVETAERLNRSLENREREIDARERTLAQREQAGRDTFDQLRNFVASFDLHIQELVAQGLTSPPRPELPALPEILMGRAD